MSERLCCFCKHWEFQSGSPNLSDVTPGYAFHMSCEKGHWKPWGEHDWQYHEPDFRKTIVKAADCPDYEQA